MTQVVTRFSRRGKKKNQAGLLVIISTYFRFKLFIISYHVRSCSHRKQVEKKAQLAKSFAEVKSSSIELED